MLSNLLHINSSVINYFSRTYKWTIYYVKSITACFLNQQFALKLYHVKSITPGFFWVNNLILNFKDMNKLIKIAFRRDLSNISSHSDIPESITCSVRADVSLNNSEIKTK